MEWAHNPVLAGQRRNSGPRSASRKLILQLYRQPEYEHSHGPYFGKDAFRLLRDMQDPAWVETYQYGG